MEILLGNSTNGLRFIVNPIHSTSDKHMEGLIELSVLFEIEDFQTTTKVLISENEVYEFKQGLLSLYHKYSETYTFSSITKDLEINFKAFPEGIISVTGYVLKKPYSLRLKFKFFFDMENVPGMNLQIKKMLGSISQRKAS